MTASAASTTLKCLWIVHEFWNKDELEAQLRLRPENGITPACIAEAISSTHATIVFVSELQRDLFQPSGASCVIYLGVEEPAEDEESLAPQEEGCDEDVFTILMLGVVCPRKGQLQMVDVFKKLRDIHTGGRKLRLCCVGARNGRSYEDDYLRDVEEAIGGDPDIHLHGIVDKAVAAAFLQQADCLVVNSSNEVTPLVIAEAFARNRDEQPDRKTEDKPRHDLEGAHYGPAGGAGAARETLQLRVRRCSAQQTRFTGSESATTVARKIM